MDAAAAPAPGAGATPAPAVLELREVRKRFGRSRPWVLDGVDLRVAAGDAVQISGANGCGKSTLLRIAAGLARAGSGSVRRAGRVALVPDRPPPSPPMTVQVYLAHQARLQGRRGAAVAAAVEDAVEEHRLGPVREQPVAELSKGWTQRCLLAQALLADADVVFLDEPWSGVDRGSHEHLTVVLDRARRAGRALVMTSHEPNRMPDLRRLLLADGRLVDDPSDVPPPLVASAATRRVWLASRDGAAGIPGRLQEHTGLVGATRDGDGVVVTLHDDASGDDLLARLLDAGWTPVRIEADGDR